jgi:outer membrane protein assembly factor BamB
MIFNMSHRSPHTRIVTRSVAAMLLLLALPACSSPDDFSDALAAINPFGDAKKKLPGERVAVFNDTGPVQVAKGKTVSIPSPRPDPNWGQAAGPVSNNPGNVALSGTSGDKIWQTSAADPGAADFGRDSVRVFARPVAADGRIFTYDPNGNVSAHSSEGGGQIWKVSVRPADANAITSGGGIAVSGNVVYVNSGYGVVAALDASSGSIVWTQVHEHPGRGAPTVADGKVFLVSEGNVLYCLNAADGKEIWTFKGVPEVGGLIGASNPAVSGGVVVVPFSSGELVAVDIKTGSGIWTEQMARASRNYAVSGMSDITGSPVIDDGVVYASGIGNRTGAFNLKTGAKIWDVAIGSAHTPAVAGNAVFVIDLDDTLYAIDRKSGEIIWNAKMPVVRAKKRATHWAGPVIAGDSLWLVSNEGGLIGVSPQTGQVTVNKDGSDPMMSAPVVANGKLVTLSATGKLAAFD